jgi:hypothetical protein
MGVTNLSGGTESPIALLIVVSTRQWMIGDRYQLEKAAQRGHSFTCQAPVQRPQVTHLRTSACELPGLRNVLMLAAAPKLCATCALTPSPRDRYTGTKMSHVQVRSELLVAVIVTMGYEFMMVAVTKMRMLNFRKNVLS